MAARLNFVLDLHLDAAALRKELPENAPITVAAERYPRKQYRGAERGDEDRDHILQLAFERDATVVTADGGFLLKARNFGPCYSNGHVLGGVIVLPVGKEAQVASLRAFNDGAIAVQGLSPGDFGIIWEDNLGVDLRQKVPTPIDLCDCLTEAERERLHKRYKLK